MGKLLEPVDFAKDLGITLDNHLSYDNHISELVSSCLYKLCQINGVKNKFDRNRLITLLMALWLHSMVKNFIKHQETLINLELCLQNDNGIKKI